MNFRYIAVVFLISCTAYASTLDDVRSKTGWESPHHSGRNSIYIPLITPAGLIADLTKHHRDRVKMKALFYGITTQTYNTIVGPKNNRYKWSGTRYISFRIKDPQEQISPKDIHLFISKNNPDSEKLFDLTHNAPILLIGIVRDTAKGKAWVEVEKIEVL